MTDVDIEEFRIGDSAWYEFDGTKVQGKAAAQEYANDMRDLDEAEAELSAELEDEEPTLKDEEPTIEDVEDLADSDKVAKSQAQAKAGTVIVKPDDGPEEDQVVTEPDEEASRHLVEMRRHNKAFEFIGGERSYLFTEVRKILPVDAKDVDALLAQGGFMIVTPARAKEFYS